ncbi:thermolysin metallopeptidase-like protein [Mumia flava]|uniref:Neutral metalloproteinase n=1 Tax=Mumia flava TaxID=1348852 RepID=A0A2M9BKF5_9ACTN|nr:M4 family metallopeptidase [Mumia flava]PJJ58426.1 thermolysin metallopeptidase-like protein [Mumia flava]
MTCGFVPPYLLDRIAASAQSLDDPALRTRCARTRRDDLALRAARATAGPDTALPQDVDGTKAVYSAGGSTILPGALARGDDAPPTGDAAVDEAYDATSVVHETFAVVFGRDSVDGRGSPVTVTVHYGQDYDNAFWDGSQLVFGDGDGQVFGRFTDPPDVLFHEFTHGVTQFSADLVYRDQPGALNESMSDVFAAVTTQRALGQDAADADWLIGRGLFLPGIQAEALRSMRAPGTAYDDPLLGSDPQVASMDDYIETDEDNGGVHLNSGIPNHAFYRAATALGGRSWEVAGPVWYAALTGGAVGRTTDFAGFAQATVDAAAAGFGADVAGVVADAWAAVGVAPVPGSVAPVAPVGGTVTVVRTGGFAGMQREGVVDLERDPRGPEVARLVSGLEGLDPSLRSGLDQGGGGDRSGLDQRGGRDRSGLDQRGGRDRSRLDQRGGGDRFVYAITHAGRTVRVGEADLDDGLARLVRLVLGD